MDGIIVVNGQWAKPLDAKISVLDRGLLFGDNVFEVCVGFGRKILDMDKHLNRLRNSAALIDLPIPWSDEELSFELHSVAEKLGFKKIYLRLMVTRGNGLGLECDGEDGPSKIIYGLKPTLVSERFYEEGIKLALKTSDKNSRGERAKTGNYLDSIIAIKRSKSQGFDDILWCNTDGEITESSTANIFFIARQGDNVEIVTPSIQSGLLKGITRETLRELLIRARIPVREEIIYKDELAKFDEAFVCSTVKGLIPVQMIGNQKMYTLRKNSVYRHINHLYQTWVSTQVGCFVDWNTGEILSEQGELCQTNVQ